MKVIKIVLKFLFFIQFVILTATLTACGTSTVKLSMQADSHLNQDTSGRSLPVIVRVYTLTNDDNFLDATFRELWRDDKSVLGNTLIDREEYTLNPRSELKINIPRSDQAEYFAVIALFRHPEPNHWRVISKIPNSLTNKLSSTTIQLSKNRVRLEE
jgi:type VI secretion system protein VasD